MNDDLRAAAQAATPGPWWVSDDEPSDVVIFGPAHPKANYNSEWVANINEHQIGDAAPADAAYIALASPDRILALLDRLDVAEGAISRALDVHSENDCSRADEILDEARAALEGKPSR